MEIFRNKFKNILGVLCVMYMGLASVPHASAAVAVSSMPQHEAYVSASTQTVTVVTMPLSVPLLTKPGDSCDFPRSTEVLDLQGSLNFDLNQSGSCFNLAPGVAVLHDFTGIARLQTPDLVVAQGPASTFDVPSALAQGGTSVPVAASLVQGPLLANNSKVLIRFVDPQVESVALIQIRKFSEVVLSVIGVFNC
jgi:hypothetical protein